MNNSAVENFDQVDENGGKVIRQKSGNTRYVYFKIFYLYHELYLKLQIFNLKVFYLSIWLKFTVCRNLR